MRSLLKSSLLAVLFVILAAGCADSTLTNMGDAATSSQVASQGTNQGKARHAGLMGRATRTSDSDVAGKDGGRRLGLIMKVRKLAVMERYAVLERYRLMERYKLLERYTYNDVIGGFAISIEDLDGDEDYQEFLQALDADPDIAWYEPDFDMSMPGQEAGDAPNGQIIPWSVAAIGGMDSWTESGNGSGSVDMDVYVLDTGIAKAWNSDPDDDLRLVESLDFREAINVPVDDEGHGTHVAGIIGAIDDYDNIVGVSPGVRIHNFKVLGDDGTTDVSVVLAAIEELTSRKLANPNTPMIVNLSLGENLGNEFKTALDEAIETSIGAGVHYVVAAGNDGVDAKHVTPARVEGAITVGSYDVSGQFSSFSNWGDGVDLLAPGDNIISLSKDGTAAVSMSGTSMAAAHVTGAVALYVAQNENATPAEAKGYLLGRAGSFVTGQPDNTTNLSVWVGAGMAPAAPVSKTAFLDYALIAGERLEIKEDTRIGDANNSGANANVHANQELKLADDSPRVEGFGTYVEKVNGDTGGVFNPNDNPRSLASVRSVREVPMSGFDADAFAQLANMTYDGDMVLSGSLALSADPSNPTLLYVDGKVKVDGNLNVTGYGVIFANDNVEIKDNVTTTGALGIFSTKALKVREKSLTVEATLISGDQIELNDDTTLYGSAHTTGNLAVKAGSQVFFRGLPAALTSPFWQ